MDVNLTGVPKKSQKNRDYTDLYDLYDLSDLRVVENKPFDVRYIVKVVEWE